MQPFGNSWHIRALLVMVMMPNQSLKLAESIVTLHTRQHRRSTMFHPLLQYILRSTHFVDNARESPCRLPKKYHAQCCLPQTADNLYISNYTILNTFKLRTRRICLFIVCPNVLNPLSVVDSLLTMIQSKTWTHFPTTNMLKVLCSWSLNFRHFLCCEQKSTPPPVLPRLIT
jgi:hypothetical protein